MTNTNRRRVLLHHACAIGMALIAFPANESLGKCRFRHTLRAWITGLRAHAGVCERGTASADARKRSQAEDDVVRAAIEFELASLDVSGRKQVEITYVANPLFRNDLARSLGGGDWDEIAATLPNKPSCNCGLKFETFKKPGQTHIRVSFAYRDCITKACFASFLAGNAKDASRRIDWIDRRRYNHRVTESATAAPAGDDTKTVSLAVSHPGIDWHNGIALVWVSKTSGPLSGGQRFLILRRMGSNWNIETDFGHAVY